MRLNKMFLTIGAILGLILISITAMAQPSLVASYPFNGNANDESGNGHDGTINGAVLSTDRFGNPDGAYYFDGSGAAIDVASSPDFGPDSGIIIDLWIRPTAYPDLVGTGWEYHKMILSTTTDSYGFSIALYSDSLVSIGIAPYPWVHAYSQTRIQLNVWTHLRGTFQQSTGITRLFVNDVLEGEAVSATRDLGTTGFVIGRNPLSLDPSRPHAFAGDIDDIQILTWGTSDELSSDASTIALLHMNENSGSTVSDASSFANHGTAYAALICDGWAGLSRGVPKNTSEYGVIVQNSPSISNVSTAAFTLECYIYLEAYDNSGLQIIHNEQFELGMGSYGSSGYLQLQLSPGGTSHPVIQSPQQLPLYQWVHVAATWDGMRATLFVNGVAVRSEAVSWSRSPATTDLRIGDHYGADTQPSGKLVRIDEVRISNTLRYGFVPGDADGSGSITISDAVYLINYVFGGGPAPDPLAIGDANGDCMINISDCVYLINFIFGGGSAPVFNPDCKAGSKRVANQEVADLTATRVGKTQAVVVSALGEIQALQLALAPSGEAGDIAVTCSDPRFQVFSGWVEGEYRVGVIDLTGTTTLPAGTHNLLTISHSGDGELTLREAIVVDNDANEMNVEISNSKLESILPTEYSLGQNQPNPFNPSTDISFSLPKTGQVKLVVYNILGAEVVTLVDEVRSAGVQHVTWNGTNSSGQQVASGIYLYRLTAGDFATTKKMLLLK